jgi:hypothetical protein
LTCSVFHGLQPGPVHRVALAPALQARLQYGSTSSGPLTGTLRSHTHPCPAFSESLRAPCPCSFFTRFLQRTVDVPLTVLYCVVRIHPSPHTPPRSPLTQLSLSRPPPPSVRPTVQSSTQNATRPVHRGEKLACAC